MIATEFKPIPLSILYGFEDVVLRGLDSLPLDYRRDLLGHPSYRYPWLYYLLFTYWPHLLESKSGLTPDDLFYNRYYWFARLVKEYEAEQGTDAGLGQPLVQVLETLERHPHPEVVHEIDERVAAEMATNDREIAVAFSDFSVSEVKRRFGLHVDELGDFFASIPPAPASPLLADTLHDGIPLALAIGTEKARSELIIAPVLVEVRRRLSNKISFFSGVDWNVDAAQGLRGVCDFLLSRSPEQLDIEAPVVAVVEAKKEDMRIGIGQCLAEMVAARIFNQQRDNAISTVYGVVTTGNIWKFLRLVENTAYVDVTEYHIKEVERIIGVLLHMVS
jgi:hypothetical protein